MDNFSEISAKTLLGTFDLGPENYFGIRYNMNLYRGCQHACIYCDTRSRCYGVDDISHISRKVNSLELLNKELASKRKKGTVGTGSMNDPYMPLESKLKMTRNALKIINQHGFPVHIITKSDLVTRDIDILKQISTIYAAVSLTITCAEDPLSLRLEPNAPPSSKRFAAISQLNREGIYTGIVLSPVLPFITDNPYNVRGIVEQAGQAGAKYILNWMGMTMRDGQRQYFYKKLDRGFPGIRAKYERRFRNKYSCSSPKWKELSELFSQLCAKYNIPTSMKHYTAQKAEQDSLF